MRYRSLYFRRKAFQHKLAHLRWYRFKENAKTLFVTCFAGIGVYMIFVFLLLFG